MSIPNNHLRAISRSHYVSNFFEDPRRRRTCDFVAFINAGTLAGGVVTGTKHFVVLRVYFNDYSATSRYSQSQVEGFMSNIAELWGTDSSYGNITFTSEVSSLFQLPSDRSAYIDDFSDGDLSNGGKYMKVLNDATANAPAGINWNNVDGVVVIMAETDPSQFHRGQGNKCNIKLGSECIEHQLCRLRHLQRKSERQRQKGLGTLGA